MAALPSDQSWLRDPHAPLQRAASWNPFFYRFFGSDHSQVPLGLRPFSGDESCRALADLIRAVGGQHPRPHMLRRCLSQMWLSGYRPSETYASTFQTLVSHAFGDHPRSPKPASHRLLAYGRNQYRLVNDEPTPAEQLTEETTLQAVTPKSSKPTVVTFDGAVWTVKKEFELDTPLSGVRHLLDPLNWQQVSPFFKETRRIDLHRVNHKTGAWEGVLEEKVAINWNGASLQSFDAFLKVDYNVETPEVVRADYSLEYEKDNQLLVDDGYGEARRVSDRTTQYTGYKRFRFASSYMNLVAPAVLCMLLEHDEDGFLDVLPQQVSPAEPAAP